MPVKAGLLSTKAWLRGAFVHTKCLKRLQKRSIDDNLRQLVLLRQDRVLVNLSNCFIRSDPDFFVTFPKKWVGRAMGNETFYGDGLICRPHYIALPPLSEIKFLWSVPVALNVLCIATCRWKKVAFFGLGKDSCGEREVGRGGGGV